VGVGSGECGGAGGGCVGGGVSGVSGGGGPGGGGGAGGLYKYIHMQHNTWGAAATLAGRVRDYAKISEQYISRVMSGEEIVCHKVKLTIERHLRDLAKEDSRFYFDPKAGAKVCKLFDLVRPSKWPKPMVMQPWMVTCTLLLYGWKRKEDKLRRFQVAFLDWARKTGKSAYLSVCGIHALASDGERGAEVYSAALVEQQARRVFDEAVAMVRNTPVLRQEIVLEGSAPCRRMRKAGEYTSEFRPLSRDKDAIQGTFPSFAACDEVHVWKGRGPWDDIRYGMTARSQPLIIAITTAPPADDTTSICNTLYNHAEKVLAGVVTDEAFFAWIAELDPDVKDLAGNIITPGDKWEDETVWIKACPNLGVTVKWEAMRQLALEAKNSPESLTGFKRYSLNIRVDAVDQPIPTGEWDGCARPGEPIALRAETLAQMLGRICFAALDLALTDDTSALALLFPPMNDAELWRVVPFFWIPADNIQERVEKHLVPYNVWRDQGFLITTPGKYTDYDFIAERIKEVSKQFDLRELAYDPALASGLIKKVLQNGFKKDRVVKFNQTMMNYAAPCGDFVRAIGRRELQHDADPVLRWQITNLRWLKNHTGLIMPDKLKSIEKIDGAAASIMAWGRATHPDNAKLINAKPKVTLL
jgi:phage terminase large subunit-like protein